jgi:hypothetical protein
LSEAKFREIVKYFSLDIEANKAAVLASLNRNTINRYYMLIRRRISEFCEVEECRSGMTSAGHGSRVAENGPSVFGICLINDKIYTEIIDQIELPGDQKMIAPQNETANLMKFSDNSLSNKYYAVVDYRCGRYIRIKSNTTSGNLNTAPKTCDIFWGYVKSRLMKFKGISKSTMYYHIKECEFRFNNRNEDLYKLLLKIMRQNPLS